MAGGVEAGFAAMGLGDLFDEGEAGAVGSEAVVFYAGALADAGACGWGVAFDEEDDVTVARKSTGADGAARWIVAHAVVQEIGEGAAQKLRIGAQRWQRCFRQIDVQRPGRC